MSDAIQGSIEFGVFLIFTAAVFLTGRDRGPEPEDIEMGSGRRTPTTRTDTTERRLAA